MDASDIVQKPAEKKKNKTLFFSGKTVSRKKLLCKSAIVKDRFERCYNERMWECYFSKRDFRSSAGWEYAYRAGKGIKFCKINN